MFRRAKADAAAAPATSEAPAPETRAQPVERYLAVLRRRAVTQASARAAVLGMGVGALVLTGAAYVVGPVASWPLALASWLAALVTAGATMAPALRSVRRFAGARAARLLSPGRASLASAARSAVELAHDPDAATRAPTLVAAHAARVREALAELSPATVLPWRALRARSLAASGVGLLLCGAFTYANPRALAGAWALTHPAERDARGHTLAAVVETCDARLVYPPYLGRDSASLRDVTELAAPAGTTIELTVWPRVAATDGSIDVAGRAARLVRAQGGSLSGRFVVREGGALTILVREGGRTLRDPTARAVRLVRDEAPRIALTEPSADRTIDVDEEITIFWSAKDDVGLSEIELVVKTADGHEVRRRLADYTAGARRASAAGTASIVASALGAQPGDHIALRVDARDGDVVNGPNVGESAERTLTVASDATRHAQNVAGLKAALDLTLTALADRLERPLREAERDARTRFTGLGPHTPRLARTVREIADALRADESARRDDASALAAMAGRLLRRATEEAQLHGPRLGTLAKRTACELATVAELEQDALLLADLLGRAQLEDAAAIMRELERLRRRMTSLLAELRRNPDEQARRALLAEVARAELRMRELTERLAQMGTDVPSDFANQDAMPSSEARSALDGLREALLRNDVDEATRLLDALARELQRMASALGTAQQDFAEARFGPREQAMAEAMDALAGLEAEQRGLAERSSAVRRRAAERAQAGAGEGLSAPARRLAERARDLGRTLDGFERRRVEGSTAETLDRARQRAHDTEDALRSEDLSEASRMASEAQRDTDDLAQALTVEAEMFGGTDGRSGQRARAARDAARGLGELSRDLDEATARMSDFVDESDRAAMHGEVPLQRRVREAATQLGRRFAHSPDATPLSTEGEQAVADAAQQMMAAEHALGVGDPRDAARAQDEAARTLAELREQLEQDQHARSGGRTGDRDGTSDERGRGLHEAVRIPGAEDFAGPAERRRQVLDAMREGAPSGWEDAVRRYYEAILR